MNRKPCVFLCPAICLSAATRANAYIDPGIGTYTFQILIAGLMATFFFTESALRPDFWSV